MGYQWRIDRLTTVHSLGFISAILYIYMGLLNESAAGLSLLVFYSLLVLLFSINVYLAFRVSQTPYALSINAVLMWAVIFRGIGVIFSPIYEDDHFRFLWDGFIFYQYGTPYGIAPSEFFDQPLFNDDAHLDERFHNILSQINYPETPTVYGPIMQLSFLISYLIFPGDVIGLKLIFVACDLGVMLMLRHWAPKLGIVLYAWSPLIIKEIAFTAHPDILAIVWLVACFFMLHRHSIPLSLILLALAVCTKIFALLMVPFVLVRCHWKYWWIFIASTGVIYAPFLLMNGNDIGLIWALSLDWQFNGSIHWVLSHWMDASEAKFYCLVLFCLLFFGYWLHFLFRTSSIMPRGDWVYACFLLLSPVVNAWYFVWVLIFAAMQPSRWAWGASLLLMLSYITGVTTTSLGLQLYEQPLWGRVIEYSTIAILVIWDMLAAKNVDRSFGNVR